MSLYKYQRRQTGIFITQPFIQTYQPENLNAYSECLSFILVFFSIFAIVITFPISLIFCTRVIKEYERAVIFRLGRCFDKVKGPGLFFILPCIDTYQKVDTRTITFDVKPQEILTKDSVTITVDAIIFFRIFDPFLALNKISNVQYGTRLLTASTLRNILGTRTLQEILQEKERLAHRIQLQKAMAAEAEAVREAKATIITANGEKEASHSLKQAADSIVKNPAALHLRYLQTLSQIASQNNSTIIFPIPIELNNYLPYTS